LRSTGISLTVELADGVGQATVQFCHPRLMKIDEYINFLDSWFLEIEKMGIDVAGLPLDHLGYSASSNEEYDKIKLEFLTSGKLFREAMVSGRRVGIFEIFKPLKYKDYLISAVELIEPKTGESRKSGYEHAEFTIDFPFEDLVKNILISHGISTMSIAQIFPD